MVYRSEQMNLFNVKSDQTVFTNAKLGVGVLAGATKLVWILM